MQEKFPDVYALMEKDHQAAQYFDRLPDYVKEAISQRPGGVNSFESLCHYAERLTRGDG